MSTSDSKSSAFWRGAANGLWVEFLILLTLKVSGLVSWSLWTIFSPLLIIAGVFVIALVLALIGIVLVAAEPKK